MINNLLKFFGNLVLIIVSFFIALFPSSFIVYKVIFGINCPAPQCTKGYSCILMPAPCRISRSFGLGYEGATVVFVVIQVILSIATALLLKMIFHYLIFRIKGEK